MKNRSVCLNMIVKNESRVIRRCLSSVKSLIDYWVIVDTGSTDGTQGMIKEYLKDIPGELHERPWVDFSTNRNEALSLARGKGDYFLIIDADDYLVYSEDFRLPYLEKEIYYVIQHVKGGNLILNNTALLLVKDQPDFVWIGVVHEVIQCDSIKTSEHLSGIYSKYCNDGDRSKDPNKAAKDAIALKRAVDENPKDSRSVFYLANSYLGTGNYELALQTYEKRASMGGIENEVFYSLFSIGSLQNTLQFEPKQFIESYIKAFQYRPTRIEPLCELIDYYIKSKNYRLGFSHAKLACTIPLPIGDLFLKESLYDWGALLQLFICAEVIGEKEEAKAARKKLLANPKLPDDYRSWIVKKL